MANITIPLLWGDLIDKALFHTSRKKPNVHEKKWTGLEGGKRRQVINIERLSFNNHWGKGLKCSWIRSHSSNSLTKTFVALP